jgi:hypothetical protein
MLETSSDSMEISSEPGQPIAIDSSSNSVELAWSPPEKGLKCIDSYEIKYKQCNTTKAEKWIPEQQHIVIEIKNTCHKYIS